MGQINPETSSEVEIEDDGDVTVTFSMSFPPHPADDNDQS